MAFIIDENAFELLNNYLEALKRKFNNEAERQEILNDIEARIAEMLSQKLANRKEVVSISEVQTIMDAMGKPEDIAGEEAEPTIADTKSTSTTTTAQPTSSAAPTYHEPVKKRLFRDADDAKVAGVIAGLCHYFGINDPVWLRIIAVLLIFVTKGGIIPLYLLLVIVVPKALTASEKLQMKGEPININTIEKEIKDSVTRTGESVSKFIKDDTFFERAGSATVNIAKVILRIFIGGILLVAIGLLMAVIVLFVTSFIVGNSQVNELSHFIVDGRNTITIASFGFLLFFGAPLASIIHHALRVFTGSRSRTPWLGRTLFVAWITGVILLTLTGYRTAINFRNNGSVQNQTVLMQPAGTLYVQLSDATGKPVNRDEEEENEDFNVDEDGVFINGKNIKDLDKIPVGKPALEIMASEGDSFYIQKVITSKGRNKPDANVHANETIYTYSQTDSVLNLSPYLYIDKKGKWRAQNIKIRIAIPEGKQIRFAHNIDFWTAVVKGDRNYDDTYFANTTWTVEKGKVKCIAGENHFNASKEDKVEEEDTTEPSVKSDKKNAKDSDNEDDKDQDY